jgi:hypothetical protein
MKNPVKNLPPALREVFAQQAAWVIAGVSFVLFLSVYLLTLPATFTGGMIGFQALGFLTPALIGWSLFLAFLLSLLIPMTVHLLRRGYKTRGATGTAAGGIVISLLTPLLCCSPILPIVISFLAGWIPVLAGGASGFVQGFLATHEDLIYSITALILLGAILWDAREITRGACCAVPHGSELA